MNFFKSMALLCGMALVTVNVSADDKQVIQDQLKKIIPNAPKANIKQSIVPGLYEVSVGTMVIYMTADGKYAFNGSLINLETRENLTDKAKSEARKLAVDKIPADSMIVYPAKGEQKHYITVFTDIDCPYCHKLHKEVSALNEAGVTVRYLAYPRSGLGSPSYFKAVSVWCAADRGKALDDAMHGKKVENKSCENNPVANHLQQAQIFGVNGTPNIILDNGRLIPGYVPSKELLQILAR